MLLEVRLHQFGYGERSRDSLLPPQPVQLPLQSLRRVTLGSKTPALHSLRVSAPHPKPIRPQRLPVPTGPLQLDQLALL
jgi:hypothetical protein